MLKELNIENYILIDKLSLNFDKGLTVLTGESGAGKSIILNAIKLCLGDKSSKHIIRDVSKKAKFELIFEQDELYVITREVFPSGKSISRLNGDVISITELKKVTEKLIDLFSQKEHNYLLDKAKQVEYIDNYGGSDNQKLLEKIEQIYIDRQSLISKLKALENDNNTYEEILFEYEEISKLGLDIEKDKMLDEEYNRLINIGEFRDNIYQLKNSLDNVTESLYTATDKISEVLNYDSKFEELSDRINSAYYEVRDMYDEVSSYDIEDVDDSYIRELEERIGEIDYLKKKYSKSLEELYDYQLMLKERIDSFNSKEDYIKEIKLKIKKAEDEYRLKSIGLKNLREKEFNSITNELEKILNELSIKNAKFKLIFTEEGFNPSGLYETEIYASLNKMGYKPLKDIASGGELSRIMLALKTIYTKSEGIKCIFFDEIDAGISGKSAFEVGVKLKEISNGNQVVSITHLPQIACFADSHLFVTKDKYNTEVRSIDEDDHIERIAFMMSSTVSDKSIESAKELIAKAQSL